MHSRVRRRQESKKASFLAAALSCTYQSRPEHALPKDDRDLNERLCHGIAPAAARRRHLLASAVLELVPTWVPL